MRPCLHLPERHGPPDYRILRPWNERGYARPHANQFVLETDPRFGGQAIVTKLEDEWRTARPLRGGPEALLYLPHLSSDRELREDERIRELETANPGILRLRLSRHRRIAPRHLPAGFASSACTAATTITRRMRPCSASRWPPGASMTCSATLDWMASFGYDQVHLVAQGWGTIPGALAALLDERVRQVTLIHAPTSYSELAEAPMQDWPFSAMLPGVLEAFDLTDLYRELKDRQLEISEPWNCQMAPY